MSLRNQRADTDECFHANAANWFYSKCQSRSFNGTNYLTTVKSRHLREKVLLVPSHQHKRPKTARAKPPQNYKSLYQKQNFYNPLTYKIRMAFYTACKQPSPGWGQIKPLNMSILTVSLEYIQRVIEHELLLDEVFILIHIHYNLLWQTGTWTSSRTDQVVSLID